MSQTILTNHHLAIIFMIAIVGIVPQSASQTVETESDRNMDQIITELSKTRQLLEKISFENALWSAGLFMIGIIIAYIAIRAAVSSTKHTEQQLKLVEQEMERKLRPILGRTILPAWNKWYRITPYIDDDGNVVKPEHGSEQRRFVIAIKNVGAVAATDIKRTTRRIILSNNEIKDLKPENDREDLLIEYGHKNEFKDRLHQKFEKYKIKSIMSSVVSLQPNEIQNIVINLDEKEWEEVMKSYGFYFELVLEYGRPEKYRAEKYTYSIIGQFKKGLLIVRKTYID